MKLIKHLVLTLFLFGLSEPVFSSDLLSPVHVKADLLSEVSAASHDPFWVLVRFQHDKDWHTYWTNPGDSGLATQIKWTLPPGFKADPPLWPTPKLILIPPLASFAYENEALFLIKIYPPQGIKSAAFKLSAAVNWLECKESCLPGKTNLELTLPFSNESKINRDNLELFSSARANLPLQETDWTVTAFQNETAYLFHIEPPSPQSSDLGKLTFFPDQPSLIANAAPQIVSKRGSQYFLTVQKSELQSETINSISGVLRSEKGWRGDGTEKGWAFSAAIVPGWPLPASSGPALGLLAALGLAFLGGIILNIMPCVLPVLSIKVLGFAKQVESGQEGRIHQPLLYTLGVLVSFWTLAGLIVLFREGGKHLGWGFQLQSPSFIIFLIVLFFSLALNLFGLFEIGVYFTRFSASAKGFFEPFFSGVLASVVATPCTAPFMGVALGYALSAPLLNGFLVFTCLGLGMALPFAILLSQPGWLKILPKPGPWMVTLKQIMGGLLIATCAWLFWVLSQQTSGQAVGVLALLLLVGVGLWTYGQWMTKPDARKRILVQSAVVLAVIGVLLLGFWKSSSSRGKGNLILWESFTEERVRDIRKEGRAVFLDFTASWCLTCQVNERVVLNNSQVQAAFKEKGVSLLKADWTNQDEAITEALRKLNRTGVPTYVLYPRDESKDPILLPEVLTPRIVLEALEKI